MRFAILAALSLSVALSTLARAVEHLAFDFEGRATVPNVGQVTSLYVFAVMTDDVGSNLPLALDYAANEYTLVCGFDYRSGSTAEGISLFGPGGGLTIYEDPRVGGTPAHQGLNSTFMDGHTVVHGRLEGFLTRTLSDPHHGEFSAMFNFDQGPRIHEVYPLNGWIYRGSLIRDALVETWSGQVFMSTVAIQANTWNGVKQLYR